MKKILFLALLVLGFSAAPAKTDPVPWLDRELESRLYFGGLEFNIRPISRLKVPIGLVQNLSAGTGVSGDEVILGFQFTPGAGPLDISLLVSGSPAIEGGDVSLGLRSGSPTITEDLCNVAFTSGGNCSGTLLAIMANSTNPFIAWAPFAPQSLIVIGKGISIPSGSSVTDLTNSQVVPEPGTLALFGSGLIGIAGLIRRKLTS
jgi:hypothetical protein